MNLGVYDCFNVLLFLLFPWAPLVLPQEVSLLDEVFSLPGMPTDTSEIAPAALAVPTGAPGATGRVAASRMLSDPEPVPVVTRANAGHSGGPVTEVFPQPWHSASEASLSATGITTGSGSLLPRKRVSLDPRQQAAAQQRRAASQPLPNPLLGVTGPSPVVGAKAGGLLADSPGRLRQAPSTGGFLSQRCHDGDCHAGLVSHSSGTLADS